MKKIISILCIVAMMLSFTTICANAWAVSDNEGYDDEFESLSDIGYIGDVNSTWEVDITDATLIQMHIAKLVELRSANKVLSDVDQSGDTDIMDATCIQMWIAKIPVSAPVYHMLGDDEMSDHWCSYSIEFVSNKCQYGYIEYWCSECGDSYTSHDKEPSHDWEVVKVVEPGCNDGYTDTKCKDCGTNNTIYQEGSGTGHDWGEWQVVIEPDYGVDGEERCYCSKCDLYQYRTLDMLIEGNQDAIAAGRDMLFLLQCTIGYFDSVEDTYVPNIYDHDVKSVGYLPLIWDGMYEKDKETALYTFKRADLDAMLLKYLDTSYDWKSLNTTEGSYGDIEYYDETTDTVKVGLHLGAGGFDKLRVSSCTDNGDGTYTLGIDSKELGPYDWESHTAELVLKKTEYGYPAVSFTKVEN